jgi:4-hydroxymandelate oxidase
MSVQDMRDFETLARNELSAAAYGYYAGGSFDEQTLADNEAAFGRRTLRTRGSADVAEVDTSTTMLGMRVAASIGFAPVALQGLAHESGEVVPARVAARANVVYCLSTLSSRSIESVGAEGGGTNWFQLYVFRDRRLTEELVARAVLSGYRAIVLTVDLPVVGKREREILDPLLLQSRLGNIGDLEGSDFRSGVGKTIDPSLSWDDLAWVRSLSTLPLVLKGILHPLDAAMAVEHGVDGLVVSNHGGRQLDRVLASIDALAPIVDVVDGRAEVYLDGGIRAGTDVVTALALGARAVFIGRPYVFALAAGGEPSVTLCFDILLRQLREAMALSGARTIEELAADMVLDH